MRGLLPNLLKNCPLAALLAAVSGVQAQNDLVFSTNTACGASPYNVVAADVNGDGTLDLVTANDGDNSLTVLTNNGAGIFTPATTNINVGGSPSVAAADVNGAGPI